VNAHQAIIQQISFVEQREIGKWYRYEKSGRTVKNIQFGKQFQ